MNNLHDICSIAMNAETPADAEAILKEWIEKFIDDNRPKDIQPKFIDDVGGNQFAEGHNFGVKVYNAKLNNTIKE